MKLERTNRGFGIVEFKDQYGEECSLQESSLATEFCIWFGVNDPQPKYNHRGEWLDVQLPEGTVIHSRMHLTRDQVKELMPFLQHFAETGELE